jgi:hypothetical protein
MEQLLEKLMISKAIMNKHDEMGRGQIRQSSPIESVQSFDTPNVKYNIPSEYLGESNTPQNLMSIPPVQNTKPVGVPTVEAIKNSKLPDDIKKLMMEHPIAQPQQQTTTISNDIIEKASRLMKGESNNYIPESAKPKKQSLNNSQTGSIDYGIIKKMIEDAVNKSLKDNGLLVESSEKSNETFSFRVGKHIFEGKVTKIKKVS